MWTAIQLYRDAGPWRELRDTRRPPGPPKMIQFTDRVVGRHGHRRVLSQARGGPAGPCLGNVVTGASRAGSAPRKFDGITSGPHASAPWPASLTRPA